ncbi:MAG: hypothetical protein H3C47_05085 [Candidatus Cloacimonetes bacterium]|nr:hypothetical protein [Candidatus Cloacimonadota bacterium]
MFLLRSFLFLSLILSSESIPLYAQREGLSCLYCHTGTDGRHLSDAGLLYQYSGRYFPHHQKPAVSENFLDPSVNPRYRALREKYLQKYFRKDPIHEYLEKGQRLFFGSRDLKRKSEKTCASCHNPNDMKKVYGTYPRYVPLTERFLSLEQMQNYCLETHLGGTPLELGSEDSLSISAYLNSLARP